MMDFIKDWSKEVTKDGKVIYRPMLDRVIKREEVKLKEIEYEIPTEKKEIDLTIEIQNNTDRAIEEWGVELETSSSLKIIEAKIEGIEIEIRMKRI